MDYRTIASPLCQIDHSFPQLDIIHKHSKSEAEDTRELENTMINRAP